VKGDVSYALFDSRCCIVAFCATGPLFHRSYARSVDSYPCRVPVGGNESWFGEEDSHIGPKLDLQMRVQSRLSHFNSRRHLRMLTTSRHTDDFSQRADEPSPPSIPAFQIQESTPTSEPESIHYSVHSIIPYHTDNMDGFELQQML
jgi:hypothetical protein